MKKLLAVLLAAVLLLGLAACSPINGKNAVAVLWSGDGIVKIPNSLINAMERAMYIENIAYTNFGANGNVAAQVKQAKQALDSGCAALMVEPINEDAAVQITALAKAKDTPVLFFNNAVSEATLQSYDKALLVATDTTSLGKVMGENIKTYVEDTVFANEKTLKAIDRNGNGEISYIIFGDVGDTLKYVSDKMKPADPEQAVLTTNDLDEKMKYLLANFNDERKNTVELIITDSDEAALTVLRHLQAAGFNKDKLTTHNIPVFTVGADADAKAFAVTDAMTEEDVKQLLFSTVNLVDANKITAVTLANEDAIAETAAAILANIIQGKSAMDGIENATGKQKVLIPYTTYSK